MFSYITYFQPEIQVVQCCSTSSRAPLNGADTVSFVGYGDPSVQLGNPHARTKGSERLLSMHYLKGQRDQQHAKKL